MKKSFIISILISFLFSPYFSYSQNKGSEDYLKIAFYNCENLFDTIDDKYHNDNEFLPGNKLDWNSERYFTKLQHISRVFYSIDSVNLPAMIGLGEIENKNVLNDLVKSTYLKKANYKIVHYESSDERGIDVALLYNPDVIKVLYSREVKVFNQGISMREMLYAKVLAFKTDTLNVFVNHWKSRSGGVEETEAKRILYASTLRKIVDSLYLKDATPKIIIMGDLNDEPGNQSISVVLKAYSPDKNIDKKNLYNLFYPAFINNLGSRHFSGSKWDMFDQIIVSGDLLSPGKNKLQYEQGSAEIFKQNWMLYRDSKGKMLPSRTYKGTTYYGGYSDHLPVTISLKYGQ